MTAEQDRQDTLAAWPAYLETGLHLTEVETDAC
jgi:hypothetical protein